MHATNSISHYYPFGLKHQGYNTNPANPKYQYKYNGKELQSELNLNWTSMDFRNYDNAIGRFNSMDVFSEIIHNLSPYRFAFDNPVSWSDPTGLLEDGGNVWSWHPDENGVIQPDTEEEKLFIDNFRKTNPNASESDLAYALIGNGFLQTASITASNNKGGSNYLASQWWNFRNVSYDAGVRLNYYIPKNNYIYSQATNGSEYAMSRYHLQQSTRAQLSAQGKAISEIMKSKQAQLNTAKWYASQGGAKPSGRIRGGRTGAGIARGVGRGVVVVAAGMSIYNVATSDNKAQALATEAGGWTGAWAGPKVGATIGSFVGPWGTVVGGIVGGAVGDWAGSEIGESAYNASQ